MGVASGLDLPGLGLSTLVDLLEVAGLIDVLRGGGPFTIFGTFHNAVWCSTHHIYIRIRL